MLPVTLDVARLPILLIGDGGAAEKRLLLLDEAAASHLTVFSAAPSDGLARLAGARLVPRLPTATEVAAARLVFIADRAAPATDEIVRWARAAGALVHVEDDPARSDLHMSAVVRRGDLTIAISTGGGSPGLAVRLKRFIGGWFGPEWQDRTEEIAEQRRRWRAAGADGDALVRRTDEWIATQNWLPQTGALAPPRSETQQRIRN